MERPNIKIADIIIKTTDGTEYSFPNLPLPTQLSVIGAMAQVMENSLVRDMIEMEQYDVDVKPKKSNTLA